MTEVFRRFLLKIGITEHGPYEKAEYNVKYDKSNDICYMEITNPTLFKYKQYKEILDGLDKAPFKTSMSFKYGKGYSPEEVFNLLKEQFLFVTGMEENSLPHHEFIKPNSITFIFNGKVQFDSFKLVVETWEDLLDSADINCEIFTDIIYASESVTEQRNKELQEQMDKIQEIYSPIVQEAQINQTQGQRVKGLYEPVKLHDLNANMVNQNVSFQGLVFKVDERISKKDKMIVTLFVYDKTDSIEVTVFENRRNFARERIKEFKEAGTHVLVRGHVSLSKYTSEVGVIADFITPLEEKFEEERVDEEEEKRVELHLHTQMSTMDAVTNIAAYAKRAAKWGHKALAITDHCNVQAFPEAQVAGKKNGIKILYGCEMNMVDDELQYIFNPSPIELNKATYVVFDFETTGLSARYDKIIEFGAVKFKDGMIVDSMDLLIDPEMELSKTTTDLTHITTAMVKGQIKIKEALQIMKKFIGDSILVAHNAVFDVGFLNQAFVNNGQEKITNPVIDTLPLSRYLFPDNKAHSLGALCRQFEVPYDENVAHRADYDARVLNDSWQAMLALLTKENIHLKHEELSSLQNEKILKGLRPKHIIVFAKNAQGLKDLFKLVSLSNIKYYAGGTTKIPRREIVAYRENLLIGSACFNGEVFDTALTRGRDVLNETVKFYDFIEVQPPSNYDYLVNIGDVSSLEHIKHIIKDIITAADD
ncbi:MAG: exonuclease domain-containing protein, partial [Bacilli bacterium]